MRHIMSRAEIVDVLRKWQSGLLSAKQVHDWAENIYFPGALDYDDEEANEESVASDVLHHLDMLNMNLMVAEDIPIYLEFLSTPRGQYEEGYRKWQAALDQIYKTERLQERKRRLAGDLFYALFCKE